MKPKMQSAIEKITLNSPTFAGGIVEPTFINFFYGKNGAGKSTIARTLRAGHGVKWQNGRLAADYDVLVYDTEFRDANLKSDGDLLGVFTVNETNIAIKEQVEQLNAERKKKEEAYLARKTAVSEMTEAKGTALQALQEECWKKTADLRVVFDSAVTGKKRAALFLQEILASTPASHDYVEVKTLYDTVYSGNAQTYREMSKAGKATYALLPGYELMGKVISSSSGTDFAKFIRALNATDWVRRGHAHYGGQTGGRCPYCQQKLPADFDKEIGACFDRQYQEDIAEITRFQNTYNSEMDSILRILEGNLSSSMPGLDLTEYQTKLELLSGAIAINKQRIEVKGKEPAAIASLEDTGSLLIEIGGLIDGFNKKIKANNDIVSDLKTKKETCKREVWEYLADFLKGEVASYHAAMEELENKIQKLQGEMEQLKIDGFALKEQADDLNRQIVNTETAMEGINKLLYHSGFQGFCLQAKADAPNTYQVIRPDGAVAEKLSEGERSFIAFLYFYHLIRGSLNREVLKDKIVVIDDPVCGMDSNAQLIVSGLIREMVEVCYNDTDSPGQKAVSGSVKQIFVLTHNAYFYKEITCHQAGRYSKVSFYIIKKTDHVSRITLCTRQSQRKPDQMENYNPVQNSYGALWEEYRELKTAGALKYVIRHILKYYFIQLCGYKEDDLRQIVLEQNRLLFVDEAKGHKADYDQYNLASGMLSGLNESPAVISGGYNDIDDGSDANQCRKVFGLIFKAMHQEQHYKMMMGFGDEE